jgi:hypothetical protein
MSLPLGITYVVSIRTAVRPVLVLLWTTPAGMMNAPPAVTVIAGFPSCSTSREPPTTWPTTSPGWVCRPVVAPG